VNLIQQISLEFFLLPFNICVLILAILDEAEIEAATERKNIGELIVVINIIIPFLSIGLMIAKVLAIGFEFYQQRKAHQSNKLKSFSIEHPRPNITVNGTQEIFPNTTATVVLPNESFANKSPMTRASRMLDFSDSMNMSDLSLSPEISIVSNSRSSPHLRYNKPKRKTKSHHPNLILPNIPPRNPGIPLQRKELGVQGARHLKPPQNEKQGLGRQQKGNHLNGQS